MSEQNAGKHLVIACGGTGGHFYPTLAIAKQFCSLGGKVTLLVAGHHSEAQKKIAQEQGFPVQILDAVRLPSSFSTLISFPFKFIASIFSARRVLKSLDADLLLGMGSFASVPACLAISKKKLPLVLHEGNAFMGKANRYLVWKASFVALSLPLLYSKQLRGKRSYTLGMPLREAIVNAAKNKNINIADFFLENSLSLNKRTILIFGGSQGAQRVNQLLAETLAFLREHSEKLQIIHLTGTEDNAALLEAYKKNEIQALVQCRRNDIEKCFIAADLIICRSGASSICEIALFKKALLLIPLPTAADDHQTINAEMLQNAKAAKMLPQREAKPEKLAEIIQDWLNNQDKWQKMADKLQDFAFPDAAEKLAKKLIEEINN